MEEYLVLVYAGLTGTVTMITCTVLALTRLVFEYKGDSSDSGAFQKCSPTDSFSLWPSPSPDAIEVNTLEQLLHNICLLLSSRTREIVKAALGFIKVILFILDPKRLASHTTVLVRTNSTLPPATDTLQGLFSFPTQPLWPLLRWKALQTSRRTCGGASETSWRTSSPSWSGSLGKCWPGGKRKLSQISLALLTTSPIWSCK